MSHPYHHSVSSARRFGGVPEDYIAIHSWFDASKRSITDVRHRALRHHTEGIFECEKEFGYTITNSDDVVVPVRLIGEQHVIEDLGRLVSASDWLSGLPRKPWMHRPTRLSRGIAKATTTEIPQEYQTIRHRFEISMDRDVDTQKVVAALQALAPDADVKVVRIPWSMGQKVKKEE